MWPCYILPFPIPQHYYRDDLACLVTLLCFPPGAVTVWGRDPIPIPHPLCSYAPNFLTFRMPYLPHHMPPATHLPLPTMPQPPWRPPCPHCPRPLPAATCRRLPAPCPHPATPAWFSHTTCLLPAWLVHTHCVPKTLLPLPALLISGLLYTAFHLYSFPFLTFALCHTFVSPHHPSCLPSCFPFTTYT